ncbi:dihydroorotate dehydrogenase electron transfer subunit [Candidatus Planktophila limnetica]|uniref:Dihydroorotate dehydrogenase electron transfer subunit n=1 Tax=Candidatus Planktophila limnetica TaxID=573600 RepID=A0A249LFG5_9ACTN|nr:dihydroorotate dehydrogenase electron transfer subunit [Candidatus Planktophila limnetica]ASY27684.1 dihydroorotate dehydrogenase electron transfer subunit [Candidatus Planktophila limnetica]
MSSINRFSSRMIATVVSNKRVGQYHQILLNVGEMVNTCKPGNFVAIRVGGDNAKMILRRAFAISRVSLTGPYGGSMELIVAPFGQGSKWLCAQAEGSEIDLIAPLGTAFGIPTEPVRALLVGGGYGSAPLFGLAEVLKNRGCRVDMYLGASTGGKIYAPMEGKRSVNVLKIYTEDGSMGERGRVTEPIAGLISEGLVDVIYSCGPMPMLRAISDIVAGSDVVHQCAVEESMACGVGICMTCVLPVTDADGNVSMKRSCIDGPVMNGANVAWELVGKIPEAHL